MLQRIRNMAPFAGVFKASTTLLGLDIGSSAIKIVELNHADCGYRLQQFAICDLPSNAVVESNIRDIDAVGAAIAAAIRIMKPETKKAAVAVAGSAVITRKLQINAGLDEADLENLVLVEADQHIPYPLDEVSIDFAPQTVANHSEEMDVLLAACRREYVDCRVAALKLAGLEAAVVDVEAYAIERACTLLPEPMGREDRTVALVDIGAVSTTLNVVRGGETIYIREQLFNGSDLSIAVQRHLGLSASDTDDCLRCGELPESCEIEVIAPFKAAVVQQVTQLLQSFLTSGVDRQVDQILLAGGIAGLAGLAESCQQSLGMSVSRVDPFSGMRLDNKLDKQLLANTAPSLLLACGLAMWGEG